jgi:hypothetical protein
VESPNSSIIPCSANRTPTGTGLQTIDHLGQADPRGLIGDAGDGSSESRLIGQQALQPPMGSSPETEMGQTVAHGQPSVIGRRRDEDDRDSDRERLEAGQSVGGDDQVIARKMIHKPLRTIQYPDTLW